MTTTTDNAAPPETFTELNLIRKLWNHAKDRLDDDTLTWIRDNAVSTVSMQAINLATTVEGIGCLVAEDESIGSFQEPGPLSDLLFGLSHQIEHLAALSGLATEVAHLQGYRAAGWAKAPAPKQQAASY